MPRFGGPGRPPKVKETPVGPTVPTAPPPPQPQPQPRGQTDSDDASSTTSEPMNNISGGKGDATTMITTNSSINNNNNNNTANNTSTSNNKASSASSDVVVDHSYTAPQWLLQEKQTPKFFSIPIPPVSTEMLQAVQRCIGHRDDNGDIVVDNDIENEKNSSKFAASRLARFQTNQALDKLRQLQQDHQTQSKRVLHHKEKLANAMARKQQGIDELRREKQVQLDAALQILEAQVRAEEWAKFQQQEETMKREIELQFEQDYEEEQSRKRKQEELAKDAKEKDKDTADGVEKKVEEDAAITAAADTSMEEGEELEQEEPQAKQLKTESSSSPPKKELVSEQIQKKIEACQAKLDSLQEKKSEMVWLLKQVIKADAKRKAEQLKLKKAAVEAATTTAAVTVSGTTPAAGATTTFSAT